MRAKRNIIITSFFVLLVSAVCSAVLYFFYAQDFWSNFLLAIFGSSFLAFLISIIEYDSEKTTNLEKFYIDISNIAEKLKDIKCFYAFEPSKLIYDCLKEEYSNGSEELWNKKKRENKAKKELIKYFENTDINFPKGQTDKSEYYENRYKEAFQSYNKMIIKVKDSFNQVADINLDKLDWDYGQLHLLLPKSKLKKCFMRIYII